MLSKATYLIQEAFRTIRRHKGVTTTSVVIMSLSLLMLAVFLLATDNLLRFIGQAQQELKVYVYLDESLTPDGARNLQHQILEMKETETIVFVSKAEALLGFKRQLGEEADLLTALEANPLPNSYWVTLKNEYKDGPSIAYFAGDRLP